MPTAKVTKLDGGSGRAVKLDDEIFGITPNKSVLHQVVTAQLAAKRSGTHKTKTRKEVSGGGAKPWKQKGTGRARAGSSRSPIWIGGGVAHGRNPRDYSQRTNKKMKKLALRSALSDRASEGKVLMVDTWDFAAPSSKKAIEVLDAMGAEGKVLAVFEVKDRDAALSFRNLRDVKILASDQVNAYDVMAHEYIVFSKESVLGLSVKTKTAEPETAAEEVETEGEES